ncbi:MAG: hypothetical protein WBB07_16485 [Mycobacterium sp.]
MSDGFFYAGVCVLCAAIVCSLFPLWRSATLSPDSIERRVYWSGSALAVLLIFMSQLPGWRAGLFVSGGVLLAVLAIAVNWTSHLKINGKVYALAASRRGPDRPPALSNDALN